MDNPILRGYTEKKQPLVMTKEHWFSAKIMVICLLLGVIIIWFSSCSVKPAPAAEIPDNLYMGLIAGKN